MLSSDDLSDLSANGDNREHLRSEGCSANGTWLCLTDYRVRYLKQASEEIPLRKGQSIKISDTVLSVDWGVPNANGQGNNSFKVSE